MRLFADENADSEWIRALVDDGHDVARVADVSSIGVSAPDEEVLAAATASDRVLLTADQSDFSDPPFDDHAGIVVVTNLTCSGGEIRRAVRRIERELPDVSGTVAFHTDWI